MVKRAGFLDDALQIVVEELNGLLGDIHELHARGVNFPFGQQLETWAHRVLLSASAKARCVGASTCCRRRIVQLSKRSRRTGTQALSALRLRAWARARRRRRRLRHE